MWSNGKWHDYKCGVTAFFVCEKPIHSKNDIIKEKTITINDPRMNAPQLIKDKIEKDRNEMLQIIANEKKKIQVKILITIKILEKKTFRNTFIC